MKRQIANFILLLFMLFPLASCQKDAVVKQEIFLAHDTEIELFTESAEILCSENYLAVCTSESPVQLFELPEVKEACTYGSIGPGPEEYLMPSLAFIDNSTMGVNDLRDQSLTILDIRKDNDSLTLLPSCKLVANEKRESAVRSFVRIDECNYAGVIAQKSGEFFAFTDSSLHTIGYFGESPVDDPTLNPFSSRQRLGNCRIASYGKSMVYSVRDLPYLAKYHLEAGKMEKDWSIFFDKTYYEVKNGDLLYSKDLTFGQVLAVQMDQEYIYVLYLDQLVSDYDYSDPEKSDSNKILVFNYQGELVSRITLDCRISRMALCRDKNLLLGIARIPEPTLVKFNCPQILSE